MIDTSTTHNSPVRSKHLRLVATTDLETLANAVGEMHRVFLEHVARQEGPNGFITFMARMAPSSASQIHELTTDHRLLAESVGDLRLEVLRAHPAQSESLVAEAEAIADAIEDHWNLESHLLDEVIGSSRVGPPRRIESG